MSKSARAFKRTETLTLANGEAVEVKKPDLQKLALNAKNGEIPSFLRQQVINALNGTPSTGEQASVVIDIDNAHEYVSFLELVTKASLVWPALKDNPTDEDYDNGFIALSDLSLVDMLQITTWSMPKEAKAVSSFRGEPDTTLATTSDMQDVQLATVGSNGHHG